VSAHAAIGASRDGRRVRLGLIGCGGFGAMLAAAIAGGEETTLAGVFDSDADASAAIARTHDTVQHLTGAELVASDVDAVVVATPQSAHIDGVIAAFEAGKHVFCEKPLARTVAECDAMASAARRAGRHLVTGHLTRFHPHVRMARTLIARERLGAPLAITAARHQRIERRGWTARRATFGCVLHSPAVHTIDLMNTFLGTPVQVYAQPAPRIQSQVEYDDTVFAQIRYADGGLGAISASVSDSLSGAHGVNTLHIICEHGSLRLDLSSGRPVEYCAMDGTTLQVPVEMATPSDLITMEIANFAAAVRGREEPFITPEEATAAVAVCEAAALSMERDRPARLRGARGA